MRNSLQLRRSQRVDWSEVVNHERGELTLSDSSSSMPLALPAKPSLLRLRCSHRKDGRQTAQESQELDVTFVSLLHRLAAMTSIAYDVLRSWRKCLMTKNIQPVFRRPHYSNRGRATHDESTRLSSDLWWPDAKHAGDTGLCDFRVAAQTARSGHDVMAIPDSRLAHGRTFSRGLSAARPVAHAEYRRRFGLR